MRKTAHSCSSHIHHDHTLVNNRDALIIRLEISNTFYQLVDCILVWNDGTRQTEQHCVNSLV